MRKTFLVVASVALAMLVAGGVAWAATIDCRTDSQAGHGSRVPKCVGTSHADTIYGTNKSESLVGKGGGDTLYGRNDADGVYGYSGPDKLYGGRGRDSMAGGPGSDKLYGGGESDQIFVAKSVHGPDSSDDYVHGGQGRDFIYSLGDLSTDYTHSGVDRIYGGEDDDHISVSENDGPGDSAVDIVSCGPGFDVVSFNEGVDIVDDTCESRSPQ
jgi:Ca2+-binding RTX toxin-like protein